MNLKAALAVLLALPVLSCGSSSQPDGTTGLAGHPIVVILFDAMSAQHIHHLGYPLETSPNLDSLAAEGVTFSKAFSPAPYTLASISSLFTGRLPDRHGVTQAEHILPDAEVTLAETLAGQGYETFGAVANIQGGPLHNLEQGFEHYTKMFEVDPDDTSGHGMKIVEPAEFLPVITDWIKRRDPTRPPFFYTHILQPHMPYSPPMEYRQGLVDADYDGLFANGMDRDWMIKFAGSGGQMVPGTGKKQIPFRDAKAVKGLYDANIRYSDAALGKLLQVLKEEGLYDDALIIVTSDHGEAIWEHNVLGYSHHVFDEMVHIPLVVKFPADMGVAHKQVDALTSLMDIYPSVASWLDVATPQHIDGRPLQGLAGEPLDPDRRLFMRSFHRNPTIGLRASDTKTILEPERNNTPGRIGWFDLTKDPREIHPITIHEGGPGASELERLKGIYMELKSLGAGSVRDAEPTEAEKALIKELGYAE